VDSFSRTVDPFERDYEPSLLVLASDPGNYQNYSDCHINSGLTGFNTFSDMVEPQIIYGKAQSQNLTTAALSCCLWSTGLVNPGLERPLYQNIGRRV